MVDEEHQRPYDPEIVEYLCEGISQGFPLAMLIANVKAADNSPLAAKMLEHRSINDLRRHNNEVAAKFSRAREDGYDSIADRLRLTARGYGPAHGGESTGDVKRDRLIIDTDLKLLAKWDPKRYGDSVRHLNAAGDGDATLRVEVVPLVDELEALLNVTPRLIEQG